MDKFILHSNYAPTGDQPEAIDKLVEGLNRGDKEQVLLGVTGSGKTFTMANIIERVNRPLKENDVPLYRRKGCDRLVLHRIVKIKKDGGFVIRGDNLLNNEYDVKPEDIVGVLKAFYREGKYYDCQKSLKYKLYIFYNRSTFWCRLLWRKYLLPTLGKCTFLRKIKHALFPRKTK